MTGKTATGVRIEPNTAAEPTPINRATQRKATEHLMEANDLEYLRAQRKALDEQLRAAKASQPKQSRLEREIHAQETSPNKVLPILVGGMARRRVAAGQSADDAVAGVLAVCERLMREALAEPTAD